MNYYLLTLLACLFISCKSNSFDSLTQYKNWIFSKESGLLQSSESNSVKFQFVYIPFNFKSKENRVAQDSILEFQFKVAVIDQQVNVLKFDIKNETEYKERVSLLEFMNSSLFSAIYKDTLYPIFTHYENYKGLKNEVLIHVHFLAETPLEEDLEVIFDDQIFHSGLHFFEFKKENLNNVPQLKL